MKSINKILFNLGTDFIKVDEETFISTYEILNSDLESEYIRVWRFKGSNEELNKRAKDIDNFSNDEDEWAEEFDQELVSMMYNQELEELNSDDYDLSEMLNEYYGEYKNNIFWIDDTNFTKVYK